MNGRKKTLVIALDGATLDVLEPMMRDGLLPNLHALASGGVKGRLRSVIPPITGPAWVSFMTGKNPGRHGVFEFLKKSSDGREYPINSNEVDSRTLWEILSESGRKVVVMNVPVTYPPRKVNGVLLSDFLTPPGRRDFGHPEGVIDELEKRFGPYRLYISEVYSPGRVGRVLDELFEVLDYRVKTAAYLMRNRDWDFFMVHIWGTDRIQHELWHILDTAHPRHNASEAGEFRDRVVGYFRKVDEAVGELMRLAGEGADTIIVSDHGFGPIEKFISMNVWLLEQGYLKLKNSPVSLLKYLLFKLGVTPELGYKISMLLGFSKLRLSKGVGERVGLFRLVNRFFLSFADIDWSKSIAYSKGNYGQIFINLEGREPHGTVKRGDYDGAVKEMISRLRGIEDPETGKRVVGGIFRADELYTGPHAGEAPDITFLPEDMRYKALGTVDFVTNRFIEPAYGNYGDHRVEGILFAGGPSFKKGVVAEGAGLMDIAPTALYLLGEKVPDDMDGRVLVELLDETARTGPVEFTAGGGKRDSVWADGFNERENEEIMERLKRLGYV